MYYEYIRELFFKETIDYQSWSVLFFRRNE